MGSNNINGVTISTASSYLINSFNVKQLAYFYAEVDKILQSMKAEGVDYTICYMHWGIEYQTKQNSSQEKLAELLFNNGVDIILGSHPHVLQPMEKREITLDDGTVKNGFVIYSLGNFMSGQTQPNTRNSVILKISIKKNGETDKVNLQSVEYIPIYMYKSSTGSTKKYRVLDIENIINRIILRIAG